MKAIVLALAGVLVGCGDMSASQSRKYWSRGQKEAYELGRKSWNQGVTADDNPYLDQAQRAPWLHGWLEAKEE